MTDRTLLDVYRHELENPRENHYVHYFTGGKKSFGTLDFFKRTVALAESLSGLGIGTGDRVMILCDTRPEWHMIDIAILSLGAVNVPIYATLTPEQVAYQVRDSGATVAFAENAEFMTKFLEHCVTCSGLKHLVQVEGSREEGILALEDLWAEMTDGAEERFWRRADLIKEEDLATIVYTSGTTGEPKGVMLTHGNIVTNVNESLDRVEVDPVDLGLEFLPLCHMIERLAGFMYMRLGVSRAYCSVYQVGELMGTIRPNVFASVPRLLEKVHAAVLAKANSASVFRRALFHWAVAIGSDVAKSRLSGKKISGWLGFRHQIADRLVLTKVREALGGKLKASFCGGASVPIFVHEFFQAIGIPVQEAWGLTETSPVITLNGCLPEDLRLGSVGKSLPSYEMRIADDGELLARGPSVFKGYWNKPEQTADVFDADGFFRTGDIGTVDKDGFIFITDRKKDLIVTAGGKNIAPQPVESDLKQSPLIENAVLIGDGKPYVVALLAPNPEAVVAWAEKHQQDASDLAKVLALPALERHFADSVAKVNLKLARFEQIKDFRVLPEPLTVEGGALTPTMKVKRRVVAAEYENLIDEMYEA